MSIQNSFHVASSGSQEVYFHDSWLLFKHSSHNRKHAIETCWNYQRLRTHFQVISIMIWGFPAGKFGYPKLAGFLVGVPHDSLEITNWWGLWRLLADRGLLMVFFFFFLGESYGSEVGTYSLAGDIMGRWAGLKGIWNRIGLICATIGGDWTILD